MKVSRKVGRRKHSRSSSVSRRRFRNNKNKKSGYKKRYAKTQKGGKRGRGQKRMGARTHKRGKRFHMGGVGKWNDNSWKNDVASGLLVYQKDRTGSITSETKPCRVTLEKISDLIKRPGENGYQGENFIRFKVTMKRYKDGVTTDGVTTDLDFNKIFTIYFAFGYVPPHFGGGGQYATKWFLFQTTESREPIEPILQTLFYWDRDRNGFYPHKEIRMPAEVNTNTGKVSIKLPEEFKGIIGHDIPDKQKPDKYIFWGEQMGFSNWVDDSRSNVDFFNSLATQMYRIVRTTERDALARPAPATPPPPAAAEPATAPSPPSLASAELDASDDDAQAILASPPAVAEPALASPPAVAEPDLAPQQPNVVSAAEVLASDDAVKSSNLLGEPNVLRTEANTTDNLDEDNPTMPRRLPA